MSLINSKNQEIRPCDLNLVSHVRCNYMYVCIYCIYVYIYIYIYIYVRVCVYIYIM